MTKNISLIIVISLFLVSNMFAQKKANLEGIEIGTKAPEIILPDVNGNVIKLSDINNKIVLVNFWASWCAPCRKKSPFLIQIFREYNNAEFTNGEDGFEILSVSLDKNEIAWKNSIKKDSIFDFINVGDMLAWESPAAKSYNIRSIPSNILIDGNGKIIAVNLCPKDLKKKLKKIKKGGWLKF